MDKTACPNCGLYEGHTHWCKENAKVDLYVSALANKPTANDVQVGGDHYKMHGIQPWDFIASNGLGYFEGNIIKYVARWRHKGGVQDLEKARHYLDKLIEMERRK